LLRLQQRLTKGWVLRKVAQRFGGRLRLPICGGAALDREVGEFFVAAGLTIYAGYGLTESSPVLSASSPGRWRQGAVGQALRGVELRIAEDGEILARGPNIMFGYWQNPSATEEVLDAEGWLHTGDLGHIDAEGFLFITGRQTIL
jgi:long-chain acyl-CoA synthetase